MSKCPICGEPSLHLTDHECNEPTEALAVPACSAESDTPETDAFLNRTRQHNEDEMESTVVMLKRMERERDEARRIARNKQDFISGALGHPKIRLPWESKPNAEVARTEGEKRS